MAERAVLKMKQRSDPEVGALGASEGGPESRLGKRVPGLEGTGDRSEDATDGGAENGQGADGGDGDEDDDQGVLNEALALIFAIEL